MQSERIRSHRLHPASALFRVGSAARALLLPGLAVLFLSRGGNYEAWLMLLFVPTVIGTLADYWSYSYRLTDDELVVREGIISRNERHIPYARIQNIDLIQNPLHRLLNVAEVRIETAGGQKPEATMRVLALDAVERMRDRVFAGRRGPAVELQAPSEHDAGEVRRVHRLALGDVLLYGVIANRGMVLVAAAFGVLWQTDSVERVLTGAGRDEVEGVVSLLRGQGIWALGSAAVGALLAFLIAVRLLSVVWAFIKFNGFTLTRSGETLRAEYGLLTRVTKSLPRRRVQVLSISEGPLHRMTRRTSVEVQTAGGGAGDGEGSSGRLLLAPLIARSQLDRLIGEASPGLGLSDVDWQPISSRANRRLFRVLVIAAAPSALAAWWYGGVWPVTAVVTLTLLIALQIVLYTRNSGWALLPDAVAWRSGWWKRKTSIARFTKIQAVQLTESPFDRRHRMAGVRVDTAGAGILGHGIDMAFLDAGVARNVTDRLAREASRVDFLW